MEKTEVTEVKRIKAQLDSTQQRREAYLQGLRQVKEKEQLESALKEARTLDVAMQADTLEALLKFLDDFPQGKLRPDAVSALELLGGVWW